MAEIRFVRHLDERDILLRGTDNIIKYAQIELLRRTQDALLRQLETGRWWLVRVRLPESQTDSFGAGATMVQTADIMEVQDMAVMGPGGSETRIVPRLPHGFTIGGKTEQPTVRDIAQPIAAVLSENLYIDVPEVVKWELAIAQDAGAVARVQYADWLEERECPKRAAEIRRAATP